MEREQVRVTRGHRRYLVLLGIIYSVSLGWLSPAAWSAEPQETPLPTPSTTAEWLQALSGGEPASGMLYRGIPTKGSPTSPPSRVGGQLKIKFATNSSDITLQHKAELDTLGPALQQKPLVIEIAGHTDSQGSYDQNKRLSERRAASVRQYLMTHFSLPAERLVIKGYGPAKPIDSNDTPEGRQNNRRTEVVPVR